MTTRIEARAAGAPGTCGRMACPPRGAGERFRALLRGPGLPVGDRERPPHPALDDGRALRNEREGAGASRRLSDGPEVTEREDGPRRVADVAVEWQWRDGPVGGGQPNESPPRAGVAEVRLPELEQALGHLVRRVAWGGDGRRGTVRLELGAGELAGAVLTIHAEAREVEVELSLPAGVAAADWEERLAGRLAASGLAVKQLVVT